MSGTGLRSRGARADTAATSRFEGLEEENAALRAQLAAAAQGRSASTQSTSARSGGRQELSGFHVDTRQGGVERSHKRRAIDSPGGSVVSLSAFD